MHFSVGHVLFSVARDAGEQLRERRGVDADGPTVVRAEGKAEQRPVESLCEA